MFQLVFLAPCLGDDGFKMEIIGFEFRSLLLILVDDAGYLLQSVDEVHTGGVGIDNGDVAGVVLVFVVAFNHKTVLNPFLAINEAPLRDEKMVITVV